MTPREAFLAHLAARACGEQSLKVWRLAHRLGPVALDALLEQLAAERLITVETDRRGFRMVRLAGRAPRELPPVEIETETPAPPEAPPAGCPPAAPSVFQPPPSAPPAAPPEDRKATVSSEPPPPPSARYAGVTAPPPEVVLPAAPEPPEAPPAVEPSPTPPPVSGPREVAAPAPESLDALAAPLTDAQHGQVRALILSLLARSPAPVRARCALSERGQRLLAALPGPAERPIQMAEVVRRSGIAYAGAASGLRNLKTNGLVANPTFGFWRRA